MSSPLGYDFLLDLPVDTDDPTLLSLRDRQLRTLFEMALDGIAIADDQGRYLDVNPAACELFGLERDELLGRCIFEFAEPGFDFQEAWQEFQRQEKVRGEFRLVRADGDIRIVEYAATANFLPHRHLSVMRDITDCKRAEAQVQELTQQLDVQVSEPVSELEQTQAQLRQSQQRLESILNSVEGVVWSIHPETFETIYINPAVEQIFGCSVAEFFANPNLWFEIIHPDDQSKIANAFVRLKEHGKTRTEYRIIRRDGQVRWLSVNSYLVYDETGKPIRIDGITTDISDRIESQTRLEQIARHIPGVIYQFRQRPDGTFHFPYSSEGIREIYGVSPEEVREDASKAFGVIHSDDFDRVIQSILESAQHLTPWYCEYRVCLPDGRMLWLVGNATPQRELDGATLWHGYIRDITETKSVEAQLRQQEELYRSIFQQAAVGIKQADLSGRIIQVNSGFCQLLGYTEAELLALNLQDVTHPDDRISSLQLIHQLYAGEIEYLNLEKRYIHKDGHIVSTSAAISLLRDAEGSPISDLGIVQDISDRKAAELELEQFFSLALDLLCIADVNGRFRRLNRAWESVLGYSIKELEGQLFLDFVHPDDLASTLEAISDLSGQNVLPQFINRYRAKDGTYRYIEWRSVPYGDMIYAAARDITDRKQAEIENWQIQNFLNSIIENIPNMLFVKDAETLQFLRFNKAGEELLGYPKEALLGKRDHDFFPPEEADFFIAKDLEVLVNGNVLDIPEEQIQTNHQGTRILHTRKIPILDESGNPKYLLGISEDITERKQAEAKLNEISERLSLSLKSGGIGCWEWDIVHNTLFWDDRMYELYGANKNSDTRLTYDIWANGLHPDDRDAIETLSRQTLLGQAEYDTEFRVIHPDGSIHFLKAFGIVQHNAEGNPQKIIGVNFDISDRKEAEKNLRQNEQKYHQILDAITDMVLVKGPHSRIVWANKAFRDYYGLTNDQLKDMVDAPFNEPDYTLQYIRDDAYVFETGQCLEIEEPVTRYDGKVQMFNTIKSVIRNEAGEKILTVGVSRDISDRKQAEDALRASEEKLRSLFDLCPVGISLNDMQGRFLEVNSAAETIYGYSLEELNQLSYFDLTPEKYADDETRQLELLSTIGRFGPYQKEYIRKDGSLLPVELLGVLVTGKDESQYIWSIIVDISDRKRQEQALRLIVEGTAAKTGEEFFKSCVQYLAQVLEVRYAFIAEFVDSEKLIAKTLAFWAGDDFGDNFTYNLAATPCKNVDINAKVCRYPTSVQCLFPEDDDLVALQAESYAGLPIVDAAGNRLGLLAVLDTKPMVQDIEMQSAILRIFATRAGAEIDRIQAEATVRQSEIQLRQQTEELETTLKKLQNTQTQLIQSEKMSSLGQLVAGIAHEINNPVSFIYSNIQPATDYASDLIDLIHLYQQHYPSPPQIISDFTEYIDFEYLVSDFSNLLESMKTGATRISDIVKSLRTFSRLDEADLKKIDIHENLESTLIILQNRLNSSTVKTEISVVKNYGNLPLIECYGGLLNQVFLNLLVNSIDAIEQQRFSLELTEQLDYIGCITITTSINLGNQVIVSIQDNGCGMSPEVQKKIFNPFFTTKPVGKGTGMGLATSYQIVNDNHRGRLRCCSAPGEGTEFVIELPVGKQK